MNIYKTEPKHDRIKSRVHEIDDINIVCTSNNKNALGGTNALSVFINDQNERMRTLSTFNLITYSFVFLILVMSSVLDILSSKSTEINTVYLAILFKLLLNFGLSCMFIISIIISLLLYYRMKEILGSIETWNMIFE